MEPLDFPIGHLIELSGHTARTTLAVAAVLQAQAEGETTAWVQPQKGPLYPPDLAASGVDLSALIVVHVAPSAGDYGVPKAAEMLLQSGGFGLVVMDVRCTHLHGEAYLGRLLSLARKHQSRALLITNPSEHSLGSLIGLRLAVLRVHQKDGVFVLQPHMLKDKAGLFQSEIAPLLRRGPWGLR